MRRTGDMGTAKKWYLGTFLKMFAMAVAGGANKVLAAVPGYKAKEIGSRNFVPGIWYTATYI
eukprot:10232327-Ditylum_brightwellii.AAC.1